ncbi:MAG: hypothetical protein KAI73_05660 [Rhodospirillaceae bacterium]|nr:hypothetical protein [Rhodospirillaceae bacterium]
MPFEDFKLDPLTHDISLDDEGFFVGVAGAERVAQHIKSRLLTQKGEWILDTTAGPDWLNKIFVKNPLAPEVRAEIASQIALVPDVLSIKSLFMNVDNNRLLSVTFTVQTDQGLVSGTVAP